MSDKEKDILADLNPPPIMSVYGPEGDEDRPKHITIMPDYGNTYAWDEENCAIGIAECFPYHPEIEEIREIESKLEDLAGWLWEADDLGVKFPWRELHREAEAIAERLAGLLQGTGVSVQYRRHFNDPAVKQGNKC
ncbi:MAG: hypothetical protein Q9M23_02105 [Mariprofundaceae bacterium]|nr:hypothetical protein [Mariprofundaceae bacterium]